MSADTIRTRIDAENKIRAYELALIEDWKQRQPSEAHRELGMRLVCLALRYRPLREEYDLLDLSVNVKAWALLEDVPTDHLEAIAGDNPVSDEDLARLTDTLKEFRCARSNEILERFFTGHGLK